MILNIIYVKVGAQDLLINKKFIIGLPMMDIFGNFNELQYICDFYKDDIHTWYISPPFDDIYKSRKYILSTLTIQNINEIQKQINIIKQYSNLQLALNGFQLNNVDPQIVINDYQKWLLLFQQPDSIVILDNLIPYFINLNIPLTYSYNNNYSQTKLKNLSMCDTIVLGGKDLRNLSFIYKLKEKYNNIKIELLLNNGCHILCQKKCNICSILQQKRLTQTNKYYALAEQSLLPSELKLYPPNIIDLYKISSRPITFNNLNNTLKFYKQKISINDLCKQIDLTNIYNWYYFCRLSPILEAFDKNEVIDINQVIEYKYQIWTNILNTTNFNL